MFVGESLLTLQRLFFLQIDRIWHMLPIFISALALQRLVGDYFGYYGDMLHVVFVSLGTVF